MGERRGASGEDLAAEDPGEGSGRLWRGFGEGVRGGLWRGKGPGWSGFERKGSDELIHHALPSHAQGGQVTGQEVVDADDRPGQVGVGGAALISLEHEDVQQRVGVPPTKARAVEPGPVAGASLGDAHHLPAAGVQDFARAHTAEANER